MLILADTNYWIAGLALMFILVCVLLMLIILIQRPRGGGLSGAFGGSSNAQAVFGSKTGDALTWLTVGFFASFLLLAIALTLLVRPPAAATATPPAAPTSNAPPKPSSAAGNPAPALPALPIDAAAPPLEAVQPPATAPAPADSEGAR